MVCLLPEIFSIRDLRSLFFGGPFSGGGHSVKIVWLGITAARPQIHHTGYNIIKYNGLLLGLQHSVIHPEAPYGLPLNFTTLPQALKKAGNNVFQWCNLIIIPSPKLLVWTRGRGGGTGIEVTGMIKWGQKWRPKNIPRTSYKTSKKSLDQNLTPKKMPCQISDTNFW